jgi:hypothetical protein
MPTYRTIIFAVPHSNGPPINRFVQRLPTHEEQGNASRLLHDDTASTLQRLNINNVMDLVLRNFLDDDGLEHPYMLMYSS